MTRNAPLTQIGGASLERFVVLSALLRLIDPVRGEPTRSSLDQDPNDSIPGRQQLKQRFLDSFALICSTTSSGAETASAVCLEQHASGGAILRVARNHGLTPESLAGLEGVLQILQEVARKEKSSTRAELEVLHLVVELDRCRILSLAERVEKRGVRDSLQQGKSWLLASRKTTETSTRPDFTLWVESCPFTAAPLQAWTSATVAMLINWASQARWRYSEQLRSFLAPGQPQNPPWLDSLHKIARYHSAIKSMVKLAVKEPEMFSGIRIRDVAAPSPRLFSLSKGKTPLLATVQRLVKEDAGMIMEQLEKHLSTQDAEAQLRKACRLSLTLHAEMQLVVFYESNPDSTPRMLFIGTSKKACFLCYRYLLRHPLKLQVSACHQKIYPSWMPPPYYPIPGRFKSTPFAKLANEVGQLTKRELKSALTAPRRPRNNDSTAGPSLTLTATESMEFGPR